ncbi:MAG: hypothetical protein Q8868_06830 [Bacteroidota bacterium]|nr:hypothetical protein [Bacteroidota bacterium]
MKTIIIFLFSAISLLIYPQGPVQHLKTNCSQINGTTVNSCYHQDLSQFRDLVKLAEQKAKMDSTLYCLDLEPDFTGERSLPFRFDPVSGTFSITNEVGYSYFFNEPGNIQIDQLLFKCPEGMKVTDKNINYACVDMVQETISFTINNNAMAREIEQNRDNVRLLFIFSLKGTVPLHEDSSPDLNATDYCLTTTLRKVVVYNSGTNNTWITYQ